LTTNLAQQNALLFYTKIVFSTNKDINLK